MNTIICSESDVDLKDKQALSHDLETVRTNISVDSISPAIINEKTLKDLIENNKINNTSVCISNINCLTNNNNNNYEYQPAIIGYKDFGDHWVLANEATKKIIKEGNSGYIYFKQENDVYIVLVNIKKDLYEDGSFKKYYNPLTLSTIKRMPE